MASGGDSVSMRTAWVVLVAWAVLVAHVSGQYTYSTVTANNQVTLEWTPDETQCSVDMRLTVPGTNAYKHVAIGFSDSGSMVGGKVVIVDTTAPSFGEYDLSDRNKFGINAYSGQPGVSGLGVTTGQGQRQITFTATSFAGRSFDMKNCGGAFQDGRNVLIFAYGQMSLASNKHLTTSSANVEWVVTESPTSAPTKRPTGSPSRTPTAAPTESPLKAGETKRPTTQRPTPAPSVSPTRSPSSGPTGAPTRTETTYLSSVVAGNTNILLEWDVVENSGACELSLRVSGPLNKWLGVGLGTAMTNSKVLIIDSSGVKEHTIGSSRSGFAVEEYSGVSDMRDVSFGTSNDGQSFEATLILSQIAGGGLNIQYCGEQAGTRRRLVGSDGQQDLIFAIGTDALFSSSSYHSSTELLSVNWSSGEAQSGINRELVLRIHGYCMAIAFTLLMPLAIFFASTKRPSNPLWFKIHRGMAVAATIFAIVGLITGFLGTVEHFSTNHHYLGIAAVCMMLGNPILGMLRPGKEHGNRFAWLIAHRLVGAAAFFVGAANSYLGSKLPFVEENPDLFFGGQTAAVIFAFISFGFIAIVMGLIDGHLLGGAAARLRSDDPLQTVPTVDPVGK